MTDSLEPVSDNFLLQFPTYVVAFSRSPLTLERLKDFENFEDQNTAFARVERGRDDGGRERGILVFTDEASALEFAESSPLHSMIVEMSTEIDLAAFLEIERSQGTLHVVLDAKLGLTPKTFCPLSEVINVLRKNLQ